MTLSATANSGLDVAYAVTGPATLAGNTLTFTGAGTVTVTASQSGNGNWTAAADVSHTFAVTKATATVTLGGLSHTYDGTAKSASATTVPADLETLTTYDGNAWAPTNAGVYAVTSSVVSDLYVGESSGILTVAQAAAQVTLGALQQNYDGTPKPVSVSTTPTGLTVRVTYDASETAPTATGTYTVLATVMDANYTGEASGSLTIGSGYAAVTLDNLSHTYDGTAHEVSVTTFPADLPVTVTYDGLATAPTNAGNYAVIATVTDSGYTGSAEGILVIAQASQTIDFAEIADQLTTNTLTLSASASSGLDISFTVTGPATINENVLTFTGAGTVTVTASQLGDTNWSAALDVSNTFIVARATAIVALSNLSQTFDGTAHIATATTTPADLDVVITYNGDTNPPVNAGSYAVNATIDDAMYSGSITGLLVVAQAPAVITLSNLEQTYDGTPREAGAAVEPAEAGVNITYDGTDVAPVSTGVYEVVATTTNANYSGTTNGTLVVGRGTATITLGALSQTFDGTARTVTVTTTPADLDVVITYNGDTNPPVNAGSYAVNATIDDAMYSGNATGTLVVAKANQTITFAEIADQLTTNTLTLSASASSGLDVSFTVTGPATINENVLTFTGAGTVTITASQPGDTNWNAAPDVVRSFAVTAAEIPLTDYEQWLESKDINPTNSAYAESDVLDADGDGVSNLDEYAADTDPSNADEVLAVTSALQSSGTWTLTPSPVSTNRFYSLVHATRLLGAEQTNELGRGAVGMSVTVTNMESDTWFGFIRVRMAE